MAIFSLKSKEVLSNLTAPANIDLGAMIPIATVSLSSADNTFIQFSSIPQNYEHLQIRCFLKSSYTGGSAQVGIRFNSDATSANYNSHYLEGDGASATGTNIGNASVAIIGRATPNSAGAGTNTFSALIIDILDYANTNKYKTVKGLTGVETNADGYAALYSGLWMSTAGISDIRLSSGNGAFDFKRYSHAALYGIKRAGA